MNRKARPGEVPIWKRDAGKPAYELREKMSKKKSKIEKNSFSSAETAVILECADRLAPYSRSNPGVEGLESKLRSAVAGPQNWEPGSQPTAIRQSDLLSKRMIAALNTMEELRKVEHTDAETAERVRKSSRAAQLEYLSAVSPAAAAAWRAAEAERIRAANGL